MGGDAARPRDGVRVHRATGHTREDRDEPPFIRSEPMVPNRVDHRVRLVDTRDRRDDGSLILGPDRVGVPLGAWLDRAHPGAENLTYVPLRAAE